MIAFSRRFFHRLFRSSLRQGDAIFLPGLMGEQTPDHGVERRLAPPGH